MLRKRPALLPGLANEVVRDAALDGLVGKRTALRGATRPMTGPRTAEIASALPGCYTLSSLCSASFTDVLVPTPQRVTR